MITYSKENCGGVGFPYVTATAFQTTCNNNKGYKFKCQSDPKALKEEWPHVNLYFKDKTCHYSTVTLAMHPGCVQTHGQMIGLECDKNAALMSFSTYASEDTCTNNDPWSSVSIPTDTCLPIMLRKTENKINMIDSVLHRLLSKDDISSVYEGYYIASCTGF